MSTYCIKEFGNIADFYSIFLSVRFHLCLLVCLFANIFVLLSFCLSISFLTCQMLRSYKNFALVSFHFLWTLQHISRVLISALCMQFLSFFFVKNLFWLDERYFLLSKSWQISISFRIPSDQNFIIRGLIVNPSKLRTLLNIFD